MIHNALDIIQTKINSYLEQKLEIGEKDLVKLCNVSQLESLDSGTAGIENKILLSVINVEEERTLINKKNYNRTAPSITSHPPRVNLNLYLLFCANMKKDSGIDFSYLSGWNLLSLIVAFFQSNPTLNPANAPHAFAKTDLNGQATIDKMVFTLYSPNLENLNHLWGILGGKYLPSVMYKMRLVPIADETVRLKEPICSIADSENAF